MLRPRQTCSGDVVLAGVLALSAVATAVGLSDRQQGGVFRGHVTLVPIDVRVVDKNGKPIIDLNQDDFVVLEDGRQQTIRHFERRLLQPEPPGRALVPHGDPSQNLVVQRHRIFLIVLQRLWLPTLPFRTTDALVRFVRQRLLPQDVTSFCAWQRATEFTTDHEHVAQVIERLEHYQSTIDTKNDVEKKRAFSLKSLPPAVDAELDKVFTGPNGAALRRLPLTEQLLSTAHLAHEIRQENFTIQSQDLLWNSLARLIAGRLDILLAGIRYLRDVEGEKHLILITPPIGFPSEEDERAVVRLASDARVALDVVLVSTPESGVQSAGTGAAERTVSEMTGGVPGMVGYAERELSQIDESTRGGYVLGYYPSNPVLDGRYRTITVKVTRPPRTRVFCRNGYYARPEPPR